ncbi:hypothetical protein V1478_003100 [Vespula squamosa]|uniref:MD-2-related lipid-recognition domain-containing protein n=1 Tax=Vespula squamosa TaxID=30214 RepID=A0ABD2BS87_VESSQ
MDCGMNFSSCYETVVTSLIMYRQMLLLLIGLCALRSGLAQSDLQIVIDNIDTEVNEEYFQNCKIEPCENSALVPTITIHCEFVKEIPKDTRVHSVLYGMINGEPTDPTGVDIEMNSCQMMNDTMAMGPLLKAMKMAASCPIQPIKVSLDCYVIPLDEFPDYFPSGEYNYNIVLDYEDVNIMTLNVYMTFY